MEVDGLRRNPLVVVLLVGGATAFLLVAQLSVIAPASVCVPGNPDALGGPPLALGPPAESARASEFWYNFSVQSGVPLLIGNLQLRIADPGGATVAPHPDWRGAVTNSTGSTIATFTWGIGGDRAATTASQVPLLAGMSLDLQMATNLSGDQLVVSLSGVDVGGCPASGTLTQWIP